MAIILRPLNQFFEIHPFNIFSLILFLSFLIFLYKWLYSCTLKTNKQTTFTTKATYLRKSSPARKATSSKPTLVASSASAARAIMKTHDVVFANRPKLKVACKILYNGNDIAFARYGEYWRQMKSLCMLHVFSNTKVRSFRGVREEEAATMVDKIRGLSESLSGEVNLSEIFAAVANDVVCRAAFGRKYTGEEGCANIKELLGDFSEALGSFCMQDFVPCLGWIDWVTGVDRKANKVANALDGFIEKIVQEHLDSETNKGDEKLQDFVDILLEIQKENSHVLPRESIKAILLDVLAGGTDTSYTLLEWAMAELLRHPQAMKKLQEEVRESIQGKTGLKEDDLKNMNYLKAVIKETLRLHPPLPLLLFRESSEDVKIKGYDIGAGTQVIVNAWAIQRDSAYWEEAEEFQPERFLNSSVDFKGQHYEFIPFGVGRRGCPGMLFGIADVELVLATLAYEFNWKLPQEKRFNMVESTGAIQRGLAWDELFSLFLILSFLSLVYKWLLSTTHTAIKNKPPSPPRLPILGNFHQLGKLPHHSLRALSKKYGDLILIHLGSKPTLVASSADAAQVFLKTHDVAFANRPKLKVACKVFYGSKDLIFANYGEYWRQMKSLCMLHVLSSTKVRSFRRVREEEAADMVKKIRQLRPSEEVNLSESFVRITNDVICRAVFGKKYCGEEGCANIREIIGDLSEAIGLFCIEDYMPWLGWIDWVSGVNYKANKVANLLDEFIEKIVQEHQNRPTSQAKDAEEEQDFVDILLETQRENSPKFLREKWAMTELLRHPRVMKELQDEVRGSIQGKTAVEEDELKNMKYLKAVIKETLRLHPPAPLLLFHESSHDVKINGYDIAAGTQVIVNAWAIQRDSAYWEQAEEFCPERFLNSSVDFKGQDFEFIPFGAGRRSCPGMAFAIVDAELVLATLTYEFDWKLPEGRNFNVVESGDRYFSLFLILSLLCLVYKWVLSATNATLKNQPPSPPKLPILGNYHHLGKLPHRSLRALSKKYGDLMLLHIGSKPTLVASSADAAQVFLKTHDVVFANRPNLKLARKVLYGSRDLIFANYGEYWRQTKSLCMLHILSTTKVRSFRRVREEEATDMVKKIRQLRPSEEVSLSESLIRITNDVICRAVFGKKYSGEEGCANIREILGDLSEAFGAFCIEDYIPWLGWIDWLSGVNWKAKKVVNVLDKFVEKVVQEHQDRLTSKEEDADAKVQDFVDILLEIQRNSPVFPRESIKAILLDMIAAGTETTYTLLEWAMTELLRHPRVMKELQDEVRGSIQDKTRVDEDDLKNMKYLKAVIKETLRLHPPVPLLVFHQSSQDVIIRGYDIAAGTQVIVNAWAIQRDSVYWEEPEEFRPERFLKSSIDFKGQDFELIPFGAGRRSCPGMAFAIVDAELILATLAYEFDWKLPEGRNFNVVESGGSTTRKRDPLVAIPTPYNTNILIV
ncbi:Cytochrome P450 71A22 [Bienertia sinuspersici]